MQSDRRVDLTATPVRTPRRLNLGLPNLCILVGYEDYGEVIAGDWKVFTLESLLADTSPLLRALRETAEGDS